MAILRRAGAVLLLSLAGCSIETFACANEAQCDLRDGATRCLEDGVCAYADDGCSSGYRRSPRAVTNPNACVQDESSTSEPPGGGASSTDTTMGGESSAASDETCAPLEWFPDADGDGFGDAEAAGSMACSAPKGAVDNADDCDDADPRLRPDHLQCDANPGLLAWFRLDEAEGSGFALDATSAAVGTLVGSPSLGVEGAFRTAIALGGDPDLVDLAEAVATLAPRGAPLEAGTLEAWIWPEALDEDCTENCDRFVIHISDDVGDGFGGMTSDLHVHLSNSAPGGPYVWSALIEGEPTCRLSGPAVDFETWTHLALRWDASECTLWVNGAAGDSDDGLAPRAPWTEGRIGHPPNRPDRAFVGRIDEVMVFDHVRSNVELRRDCGRTPCPPG